MNILLWHLHGGWSSAFLSGEHRYMIPLRPGERLPSSAPTVHALRPGSTVEHDIDIVVLQRTEELEWTEQLLGRRPGTDIAAIFLEHNTPKGSPANERHFLAEQSEIPIVHVTHFNRLMWDSGDAPATVIEHGIVDPGARYSGELESLGFVVNEPVRRGRVTGTDLLPLFSKSAPVDCFGIDVALLPGSFATDDGRIRAIGNLPSHELHAELPRRRAYLHTMRWTSLGLALLEAMHLAMPVLVLDTTEASRAVPPEAGALSTDPAELVRAARDLMHDPAEARRRGRVAREFALEHYSLERFLDNWDVVLADTAAAFARRSRRRNRSDVALSRTQPERTVHEDLVDISQLKGAER